MNINVLQPRSVYFMPNQDGRSPNLVYFMLNQDFWNPKIMISLYFMGIQDGRRPENHDFRLFCAREILVSQMHFTLKGGGIILNSNDPVSQGTVLCSNGTRLIIILPGSVHLFVQI